MTMNNPKITKAIEILKAYGVTGIFRGAKASETNSNIIEFYMMDVDGVYCTVNVRSGVVKI